MASFDCVFGADIAETRRLPALSKSRLFAGWAFADGEPERPRIGWAQRVWYNSDTQVVTGGGVIVPSGTL